LSFRSAAEESAFVVAFVSAVVFAFALVVAFIVALPPSLSDKRSLSESAR